MAEKKLEFWKHDDDGESQPPWAHVKCLCIGTGRFLRSVLVPLVESRCGSTGQRSTVLVQPRGRAFLEFMAQQPNGAYPIDTVLAGDGSEQESVQTDWIPIAGAFSLGQDTDRRAFYQCLPDMADRVELIGVGLTEAGLASPDTPAMQNFFALVEALCQLLNDKPQGQKICIVDMDNVPNNGTVLQSHMLTLAARQQDDKNKQQLEAFIRTRLVFLNSMVDRIVSQREGSDGLVPRAEPIPAKALVLLDTHNDLPQWLVTPPPATTGAASSNDSLGLVVRTTASSLQADMALKLRIANATHTAVAHVMALSGLLQTTELAKNTLLMSFLDQLVETQIVPASLTDPVLVTSPQEVDHVWQDWRRRLVHPTFGASTYFITQNGAAKGGIRFGPTLAALLGQTTTALNASLAYAVAVLLRWLTPSASSDDDEVVVYRGSLPQKGGAGHNDDTTVTYADGLRYNLHQGWYEFKCDCLVATHSNEGKQETQQLAHGLYQLTRQGGPQPRACVPLISAYLVATTRAAGTNLDIALPAFGTFANAVATLYARMVAGDAPLDLLQEIITTTTIVFRPLGAATPCASLVDGPPTNNSLLLGAPLFHQPQTTIPVHSALLGRPIALADLAATVSSEVAAVKVIDLHTHLLPPTHGMLCLWGIDELLTYHYLVAEFFMTAPASLTPQAFYETLTKQQQADLVWQALFVDRSPISEACRGVITTLVALGLQKQVQQRDLAAIRQFYQSFVDEEGGVEAGSKRFSDLIFATAGVKYNIMTNVPFSETEAQYWRGPNQREYDREHYKSAVRVDPLLKGDRQAVEKALKAAGYDTTLEGARQYLRDWCDTMKPEYVMASTPHDFVLAEESGELAKVRTGARSSMNGSALNQPGAFADAVKAAEGCDGTEDDVPSVINESSDFLSQVLMRVCQERDLPLALKIGAHRAVNPDLKQAGDGVVSFADTGVLARLCSRFPKVRFLATFLSRNNQHEACVLATKFRNLHIYGCWWFCNNPSLIREITAMRVEMLGTAFTAQHSDARVLDQLLYKWAHSRAVIAKVLVEEYQKLIASGWEPTRREIRRDVERLFGGSYEEFMAKSLL